MRMAMTYADNGMSTIEVQIFLTFVVPYLTTLSLDNIYVEKGIYIE
jgi:hypothetical protein